MRYITIFQPPISCDVKLWGSELDLIFHRRKTAKRDRVSITRTVNISSIDLFWAFLWPSSALGVDTVAVFCGCWKQLCQATAITCRLESLTGAIDTYWVTNGLLVQSEWLTATMQSKQHTLYHNIYRITQQHNGHVYVRALCSWLLLPGIRPVNLFNMYNSTLTLYRTILSYPTAGAASKWGFG